MALPIYVNDDPGYLAWIEAHPEGFVMNMTPRFPTVHKARCGKISGSPPHGERWTTTPKAVFEEAEGLPTAKSKFTFCRRCFASQPALGPEAEETPRRQLDRLAGLLEEVATELRLLTVHLPA